MAGPHIEPDGPSNGDGRGPVLSRRRALGLGLGGVGALLAPGLAGCGDDDDAGATAAAAGGGTTAPSSAGATTRVVETIHGSVSIPATPQRVVALNFVDTATLFDVGVVPTGGTTSGVNFLPEYAKDLAAMPDVIAADGGVNLELVASLRPDLIIGSDWLDASKQLAPFDKLKSIAPTALFEWQQAAGNWPDQAAHFADAVGRTAELETLKARFEARAAEIKASRAAVLAAHKWALVQGGSGEWYLYTALSSHGRVMTQAGVQLADLAPGSTSGFITMSDEQIATLDAADAIAVNSNESAADGKAALLANPLFKALPATAAGNVCPMQWFFPSSYKVALALLDEVDTSLRTLASK